MRNLFVGRAAKMILGAFIIFSISASDAQERRRVRKKGTAKAATKVQTSQQVSSAISLAKSGQFLGASSQLFSLSRRNELGADQMQMKYLTGLMLYELKMYQVAAFQFIDVIREGNNKYMRQAIEKLSLAADQLGDDTLLNYAISKVQLEDFPGEGRDMLFFRIGEMRLKSKDTAGALAAFARVRPGNRYYAQALYNRGLASAEQKNPDMAIEAFKALRTIRTRAPVTDTTKVAAIMGLARSYYQKQDWDRAIQFYREIPRDHEFWHDAMFEMSWAQLRSARFRSALSNFQSLHSTYYEDFYLPESLLLRAIVYLYICKYDEMDKVLTLFERTYGPARARITDFINGAKDSMDFYNELERVVNTRRDVRMGKPTGYSGKIPYLIGRHILREGDISRSVEYLKNLQDEQKRMHKFPSSWLDGSIGKYSQRILTNRMKNAKLQIGDMYKNHLLRIRGELREFYEQAGFIRFEMINGRKEDIKKKIAGKGLHDEQIDDDNDRDFYVQNGYEYWPFRGEYWLDEIGNYHYLGKQSCE